jgi:hypothetical protein
VYTDIVIPIDIVRLPPVPGDATPVAASIFEAPGRNYLKDLVNFGPAFYKSPSPEVEQKHRASYDFSPREAVSVQTFLDFAIGAIECLELLHHNPGARIIHGELRGEIIG